MTVKDVINEVIESETLKKYFTENIETLNRWQVTDLIAGARIPLERKMEIAKELAKSETPKEFDGDYTYGDLYKDAKFALDELSLKKGELFILVGWCYEDDAQRQFECAPFFSIDKAINYIKTEYAELDENDNIYFRLEKWIPDYNGDMTMTCDYVVSNKGNIWFCDHSGIQHLTFFNSRFHNVPVPFDVGDIISLDMRPFMPLMEGIIIRNTGGFDSVSTHCMFIQCDGMLNTSSLKTANHMTMNVDDAALFSSFDAVKKAMEKEKEKMTDYELECFYLKKQWIDVEEENEIVITFMPDWTIHEIYEKFDYKYTNDLLGGEVDYLNLFNEMWFAIPTPFKEGDILYRKNTIGDKAYYENEDLFVLKNLCYWGYDDIESERKRHAWGDMDMLASGYFLYDDGRIYRECMHNYLALDYCEEELTGRTRTLKAISNYIKGKIDLRELIDAYAIITQEERIAEHRKGIGVLDEYMMLSGLKDETVTNSLSKYIEHFYPGKLYTIAGRPGMGKSTVALNLAKELKEHKRIEATYIQCEKVTSNELEFCLRGVADYKYVPEITIEQVEEIIKKSANHIFFIDSFNHIKKDGSDRAIRLKEIAEIHNAAIIVLTSVMHAPKHRNDNRPRRVDMVSNICDSLWNTSDAVVFLYREKYYNDNIRNDGMEFNVAKADQETGMFKLDYKRLLKEWRIERV